MSRPIPNVPWRTCRIVSAAALAALLATAYLVQPAGAEPDGHAPQVVEKSSAPQLHLALGSGHALAVEALRQQAAVQATAYRRAASEAAAKRKAQARVARETAPEAPAERVNPPQRPSRSGSRTAVPAQAPTVAGAQNLARSRMSTTQYNCLDNLVRRESGWNHRATNPSSGAYGLMQALPGSKMASAGFDWRTNPLTQIKWGLNYIKSRYGTPCGAWNFWTKNGWY